MTVATVATGPAAGAAAGSTTAGTTAGTTVGGAAARRRGMRPSSGTAPRKRPAAASGARPRKPPPPPPTRRQKAQKFAKEHVPRKKIERTNYQPVILMEFVAAILLTAMTPVATKKDQQGLSPYAGSDIVKLAAITLVYLILAMISVGGRSWGRVAAWLGGLILLTDGLYEASNIAKDLQVFGGGGQPKAKAAA